MTLTRAARRPGVRSAARALAAIAVIWLFPGVTDARAQSAPNWPSFQGGADHAGAAPGAGFRPPLRRVWQTSAPEADARLSAAAVVPGLAVATGAATVVGLDPITGTVSWAVPRASGGGNCEESDPVIICTLSRLVPPAIDAQFDDHGLVVYVEGAGATSAVVAIDPQSREQKWRTTLAGTPTGGPAIDGGRVFVGVHDGSVVALDEATGHIAWRAATAGPVDAPPAASGGRVYAVSVTAAPEDAHLYALDSATGNVDWSYATARLSGQTSSPTVAGGRVFVGFGDVTGARVNSTVRAFDAATGKVQWSAPVRGIFEASSSPVVSDGALFVEDAEGSVYRFDAGTGRRIWDFQFLSLSLAAAPMVAVGTVYAGLDDGSVAALNAASGHLMWRTTLRFGPVGPLASAGDLLLAPILGANGGIAAFGTDPRGRLLDIHSPTELHVFAALANYAAAFVVMLALLYGAFAALARRSPAVGPETFGPVLEQRDDQEVDGS
jgi:outer membrane protein assembly factor BamB